MPVTTHQPKLPNAQLGKLLRKKRNAAHLGLRAFAEMAKCDHTCVWRLEEGHDVRGATLLRILKAAETLNDT